MPITPTPATTAHSRVCAEELRLEFLIRAGTSRPPAQELHRLALTIHDHCGHSLLKAHRLAWGLSVRNAIAGVSDLYGTRQRGLDQSTWHRWERAGHVDADYQNALATYFGVTAAQLGLATDYTPNSPASHTPALPSATTAIAPLPDRGPTSGPTAGDVTSTPAELTTPDQVEDTGWPIDERQVRNVADQSAQFGDHLSNVGPLTLDRLQADAQTLARSFPHAPKTTLFHSALTLRNRVFALLDGRQRVTESRDLYFLAAASLGMLAEATHYLGYYREAMTHAQTGLICAKEAAHPDLTAWLLGEASLIAYHDGRSNQAAEYARQGQQTAAKGPVTVWLPSLEARAAARSGDGDAVHDALVRARTARASIRQDALAADYGGIFGFSGAKESFYASVAYVTLDDAPQTRQAAKQSIERYESGPPEELAYDCVATAHVNTATSYVLDGQLDAAQQSLSAALAVPASLLTVDFREYLRRLGDEVSHSHYRGTTYAGQIRDRIEDFLAMPESPAP